jgi:hypothetical protein
VTEGIFCRRGDGDEAFTHIGANALGLVEVAILGLGRGTVLLLTPTDASSLALALQRAAAACAAPPANGDSA